MTMPSDLCAITVRLQHFSQYIFQCFVLSLPISLIYNYVPSVCDTSLLSNSLPLLLHPSYRLFSLDLFISFFLFFVMLLILHVLTSSYSLFTTHLCLFTSTIFPEVHLLEL